MRFVALNYEAAARACGKVARASESFPLLASLVSPTLFLSSAKRIKYFSVLGLVEGRLAYSR